MIVRHCWKTNEIPGGRTTGFGLVEYASGVSYVTHKPRNRSCCRLPEGAKRNIWSGRGSPEPGARPPDPLFPDDNTGPRSRDACTFAKHQLHISVAKQRHISYFATREWRLNKQKNNKNTQKKKTQQPLATSA